MNERKTKQRTTETNVALDMSGTSFGGGDSPLVRLGFIPRRSDAEPASAQAPSGAVPLLLVEMGRIYGTIEEDSPKKQKRELGARAHRSLPTSGKCRPLPFWPLECYSCISWRRLEEASICPRAQSETACCTLHCSSTAAS